MCQQKAPLKHCLPLQRELSIRRQHIDALTKSLSRQEEARRHLQPHKVYICIYSSNSRVQLAMSVLVLELLS